VPQEEVHAVCNPSLLGNFINQRELIKSRIVDNPQVFNSKTWMISSKEGKKNSEMLESHGKFSLILVYLWKIFIYFRKFLVNFQIFEYPFLFLFLIFASGSQEVGLW
jgi:hypothetical protein